MLAQYEAQINGYAIIVKAVGCMIVHLAGYPHGFFGYAAELCNK